MLTRPSTYLPELEPEEWRREPALRVLSLGGGVQSTAIALMAEHGVFGIRPDAAIFADTRAEPAHVYANIRWIREQVNFPVYIVDNGRSLHKDVWEGTNHDGRVYLSIPTFLQGLDGKLGMYNRQCTSAYKVRVIRRKIGQLLSERMGQSKPPNCVEQWLGISTDEWTRQRDSDVKYIYNYYPLIEFGYSRTDCAAWLREHYPQREVKKSACVFCPFHDDATWARMKAEQPEEFAVAIALDERLRRPNYPAKGTTGRIAYLHSSRIPLRDVEFGGETGVNHFENDCQGHCGV